MTFPSPVAITGGSGFIGSWLVKLLLEAGAVVHVIVRDPENQEKVMHLKALAKDHPEKLRFFKGDLLDEAGYDEAFASCKIVFHVASPFRIQGVRDPIVELVDPAVKGTQHVLNAVNRSPSVERVVLTSSVAAMHCDAVDHQKDALDESHWNETATASYQPYAYSKTLAEREAWKIAEQQSRWTLVAINPAFVVGPSLSTRTDATSVDLMLQFVDGRAKRGVPEMHLGLVDVRDVAQAHLSAGNLLVPSGRYLVSNEVMAFPEIARVLREQFPDKYPIPRATVPKALMYLFGPFMGFSFRYVKRNVGIPFQLNNNKSRKLLGQSYRPIRETLVDTITQFEHLGLIRQES